MLLLEFAKAVWKSWWALMSCAIFTLLSVYVAVFGKSNGWIVGATAILAVVFFVISTYAAWVEQYRARLVAEKAIYDGRPVFAMQILQQPNWQAIDPKAAIFALKNCGQRAARYVRLEMKRSHRQKHTLQFAELPLLEPGNEEILSYSVDHHGKHQGMLCEFLEDNPEEASIVWWDIAITFRDVNDTKGKDVIRLCYDVPSKVLYTAAVPYTEIKPSRDGSK